MKIDVIIEKGKKEFWGRIEGFEFLPVTAGASVAEVLENLKMLIADYIAHEGQADKHWKRVDINKVVFIRHYDLRAFFDEYKFLNVSRVAGLAGINPSLARQYAQGIKYPSTAQAKKIEVVIRRLAEKMNEVSLVGSTM
jgi:predicted RNase H-like HicB family nuclease